MPPPRSVSCPGSMLAHGMRVEPASNLRCSRIEPALNRMARRLSKQAPLRDARCDAMRVRAAVAAVFLVGYFAFQQWEITAKVSKLEEEVNYRKNNVLSNEKIENISTSYYQSLLERQPGLKQALLAASKEMKVPFEMNGDDINQLVKEIGRLEEENRQLKSALLNHLVDSLRKSRGNYLKSKSL